MFNVKLFNNNNINNSGVKTNGERTKLTMLTIVMDPGNFDVDIY